MVKQPQDSYHSYQNLNNQHINNQKHTQKKNKTILEKKEKPIHKDKKYKKDQSNINEFTSPNGHSKKVNAQQMQKNNKQEIFDDFELSNFDDNYVPINEPQIHSQDEQIDQNSNQLQNNQSQSQGMDSEDSQNQDDIEDLRMIWVQFFNSIGQPNGLVFKRQFRVKLKKQYPQMKFTDEHDLDPQGQQVQKIKKQIMQLIIFNKKYHKYQMSDAEFDKYIKKDVQTMTQIFKESSYIFCKEVTNELYSILRKLCNIVLEFRNKQDSEKCQKGSKIIQKLKQFGNKIASQQDKNHEYFFFGYQFVKFPEVKSQSQLLQLQKKEKYKYALKHQYRKPNTQFAKLAQKAGLHLLGILRQLDSFKTLI